MVLVVKDKCGLIDGDYNNVEDRIKNSKYGS